VAGYRRGGELVAVFAMNQPKLFGKWRRQLTPRHATPAAATATAATVAELA
jgi:3-phenylpropionate/trans-cinnamate dioxygenase ferredoxin reductase subunit